MPTGLRILTLSHLISGFGTAFMAIVPAGVHRDFSGQEISFVRWWSMGIAPFLLVGATLLLAIGIGFLRRAQWSRPLCLVPGLLMLLSTPFLTSTTIATVICLALLLAIDGLYLYRRSTVIAYYARQSQTTIA